MSDYSVEVKPPARKELEALPNNLLVRVIQKIESLSHAPRPAGCKKLKGYKDQWRVRVGDWRVVYIIDDTAKLVVSRASPTGARCTNDNCGHPRAHR